MARVTVSGNYCGWTVHEGIVEVMAIVYVDCNGCWVPGKVTLLVIDDGIYIYMIAVDGNYVGKWAPSTDACRTNVGFLNAKDVSGTQLQH